MRHEKIRNQLLNYLENDLSQKEQQFIQRHLASCTDCQKHIKQLKSLWRNDRSLERVPVPRFLWTQLEARLTALEGTPLTKQIANILFPYFSTAMVVVTLIMTIFLGIQIGEHVCGTQRPHDFSNTLSASIEQEFGMGYFTAIPPHSMGKSLSFSAKQETSR